MRGGLRAPREFVRTEAALYLTGGSTAVDAARREGPTDDLESKRAAHKGSGKGDNEVAAPNWTQPDEVDLLCYEKLSDDSDGEGERKVGDNSTNFISKVMKKRDQSYP